MNLLSNGKYLSDIEYVSKLNLPWQRLQNCNMVITGATGLIGSFLIDVLMHKNRNEAGFNCKIYAISRNEKKIKDRFGQYIITNYFIPVCCDINNVIDIPSKKIDFVLHLASNTHPVLYSTEPISTITTNIIGLKNLLDLAVKAKSQRVLFASSNEIYGENRGDVEFFDENYCGYIDCNTLRAGYPESKRCGEALCQAYIKEKELDIVISRLTRTYGPTMLVSDTKAISQFIKKGIAGEDIVLKSKGNQFYSYTYVSDAVSGLLTVLLRGEKGKAYNIADKESDITLGNLAEVISNFAGTKVIYKSPDEIEKKGYSIVTKARLNSILIKKIGWKAHYNINDGLKHCMEILSEMDILL